MRDDGITLKFEPVQVVTDLTAPNDRLTLVRDEQLKVRKVGVGVDREPIACETNTVELPIGIGLNFEFLKPDKGFKDHFGVRVQDNHGKPQLMTVALKDNQLRSIQLFEIARSGGELVAPITKAA